MIEIKCYPAGNGDAFMVRASDEPFVLLVDGGYADTFVQHIRPDLEAMAARGYELDLVVATHIDADHILGLLTFFSSNGPAGAPAIIPVKEVLHNSLRSLVALPKGQASMRADDLELLRQLRQRGYPIPLNAKSRPQEIGARQGSSLSQFLREGKYRWNTGTGVTSIGGEGMDDLGVSSARIKILGPSKERLGALKQWWTSQIRRMGFVGALEDLDEAFEFLCAHEVVSPGVQLLATSEADLAAVHVPDKSITNGSSISFVVEIEGCRLLFLGDSWADETVAALAPAGPTLYDAVKVSHHGSLRNTSPELLALVDSPHFFISTNGDGHGHPDFAVLKAIVDRPAAFCRTLHFNYSTPASRQLNAYESESGAKFIVEENQTDWVAIRSQTMT